MAILYGSLNQAGFKAPDSKGTPLEQLLTERHGDLHQVIPELLNQKGANTATVSKALGVSRAWLSDWLKANGYRRSTRWERA